MRQITVPPFLREAFGESQYAIEMTLVFAFGVMATAILMLAQPQAVSGLPIWRSGLAVLLIFDIFCGCIANFTRGTNDYYAARPGARRVFIAIHVHLPLVALLLGSSLVPALIIWAYTIGSAVVVNMLAKSRHQRFAGALLVAIGLFIALQFAQLPSYMLIVAQMFMFKVIYAFAVDHSGSG